jgi:hypothetical protein
VTGRRWLRRPDRARREAEAVYFAQERQIVRSYSKLDQEFRPHERDMLLRRAAMARFEMAHVYRTAFGRDWNKHDGMDMADSTRWSAALMWLLAEVEYEVSFPADGRVPMAHHCTNERIPGVLSGAAVAVLQAMVDTPDLVERMALLDDLYDMVVGTVGGQAAEVLVCLPHPGRDYRYPGPGVQGFLTFSRQIIMETYGRRRR